MGQARSPISDKWKEQQGTRLATHLARHVGLDSILLCQALQLAAIRIRKLLRRHAAHPLPVADTVF